MAVGIVAAALAGALIAVGPTGPVPATPAARDAFDRGRTAFGRAEYQRAIEVLHPLLYPDVLLDSEGEVVQARRMLGVAYLFENKPDEARREFRKLLELRPDYRFDPHTGHWRHRRSPATPVRRLDDLLPGVLGGAPHPAPAQAQALPPQVVERSLAEAYLSQARTVLAAGAPGSEVDGPTDLPPEFEALREFYLPAPEQLAAQSSSNRQGRGAVLDGDEAGTVLDLLRRDATQAYDTYAHLLNEGADGEPADPTRRGLARELARMNLTLNTYTQWYWKADLHNLLGFLSLRADSHAQHEIRVYADAMLETVRAWVPETYAAFMDYRMGAATLSAGMLAVVRRMLAGEAVEQAGSGLSKREWGELMGVLGR